MKNTFITKQTLALLGLAFFVGGCTNQFSDYPVTAIDVIPVIYQFTLTATNKNSKAVDEELKHYLASNEALLLKNELRLSWQTPKGEQLAKYAATWLEAQGANTKKLTLAAVTNQQKQASSNSNADLTIEIFSYQTQAPICAASSINGLGTTGNNCAVESSRWQSMVYPQKMLPANVTRENEMSVEDLSVNELSVKELSIKESSAHKIMAKE